MIRNKENHISKTTKVSRNSNKTNRIETNRKTEGKEKKNEQIFRMELFPVFLK